MTKRRKRRRGKPRGTHTPALRCIGAFHRALLCMWFLFFFYSILDIFSCPFFFCSHLPNLLFSYDIFAL